MKENLYVFVYCLRSHTCYLMITDPLQCTKSMYKGSKPGDDMSACMNRPLHCIAVLLKYKTVHLSPALEVVVGPTSSHGAAEFCVGQRKV